MADFQQNLQILRAVDFFSLIAFADIKMDLQQEQGRVD